MAGGLFGKKFVLNEKCIFFALIIMILFMYKPDFKSEYTKYVTLAFLFVLAYVSMAWYDSYFDCRTLPLKKGDGLTGMLKPAAHVPEKQIEHKESKQDIEKKKALIYFGHIVIIVPMLAYVAITAYIQF